MIASDGEVKDFTQVCNRKTHNYVFVSVDYGLLLSFTHGLVLEYDLLFLWGQPSSLLVRRK
jgi:hypothetical protein